MSDTGTDGKNTNFASFIIQRTETKEGERSVPKLYAVCQDFLRLNSVFNNLYGSHLIILEVYSCCGIFENVQKREKKKIKI